MAQNLEDVGLKFSEEQIISKIITSLPSDYCHVLTARKRIRKTLILRVFEEEPMIEMMNLKVPEEIGSALITSGSRKEDSDRMKALKAVTKCFGCESTSHWIRECLSLSEATFKKYKQIQERRRSTAKVAKTDVERSTKGTITLVTKIFLELWHAKYCHINTTTLRATSKAVQGMDIERNVTQEFFVKDVFLANNIVLLPTRGTEKSDQTPLEQFYIWIFADR